MRSLVFGFKVKKIIVFNAACSITFYVLNFRHIVHALPSLKIKRFCFLFGTQ